MSRRRETDTVRLETFRRRGAAAPPYPLRPSARTRIDATLRRAPLLVVLLLLLVQALPTFARQITAIERSPTFAEGNFGILGGGVDVEDDFALVSAPGPRELHFYTRSLTTGQWNSGLTISLGSAAALAWPVALGDDLAIYYAVKPLPDNEIIEIRQMYLTPGGPIDSLVWTEPFLGLPDRLDMDGDLLIAGWRAKAGKSHGFRSWERDAGAWVSAAVEIVAEAQSGSTRVGHAVDTDGFRFAVTDPLAGSHGAVMVYSQAPARGGATVWVEKETQYANVLQGNVHFGSSVAIDGECMAVGMEEYDSGSFVVPDSVVANTGGVSILERERPSGDWVVQDTMVPFQAQEDDGFGTSVALMGHDLLVGGHEAEVAGKSPGDVAYYRRGGTCFGGVWEEVHRLRSDQFLFEPSDTGSFGHALAMSASGGIVIFDPLGPNGGLHGRGYHFEGVVTLFADGFESGQTFAWSSPPP